MWPDEGKQRRQGRSDQRFARDVKRLNDRMDRRDPRYQKKLKRINRRHDRAFMRIANEPGCVVVVGVVGATAAASWRAIQAWKGL